MQSSIYSFDDTGSRPQFRKNGLILTMEPHLFDAGRSPSQQDEARIAVISYMATSSLTKALGALQMTTVTLFNAAGKPKLAVNLKSPLILNFDQQQTYNVSNSKKYSCAFYDFSQLKWSPKGCFLDEELGGCYWKVSFQPSEIRSALLLFAACLCQHLTHFGLLLRPLQDSNDDGLSQQKPLRLITVVGCCISALALIMAIGHLIYQGM